MRTEYLEYAFLTEEERDVIALPMPDASFDERQLFWDSLADIKAARGEQPDSLALPNAGALRGDVPFSITERSEV